MAYEKEIAKVQEILKGKFASTEDRMVWENKLKEYKIKQLNAKENESILKKAGYVGWKNWG